MRACKSKADTTAFRNRLQMCIAAAGSIYALAKRSGTAPNTIRRYLQNSEPTRPLLVAIAKASGVGVEWLATGEGLTSFDIQPSPIPLQPLASGKSLSSRDSSWFEG